MILNLKQKNENAVVEIDKKLKSRILLDDAFLN